MLNPRTQHALDQAINGRTTGAILHNRRGVRMRPHNAAAIITRLANTAQISHRVTPTPCDVPTSPSGCSRVSPSARCNARPAHVKADTTIGYDQSDRSFHRDPTFVLLSATAR